MIPPVIRLGMWYRMVTTMVWCEHCARMFSFATWHAHMSREHFGCPGCRLHYVTAFDEALGYLWQDHSPA